MNRRRYKGRHRLSQRMLRERGWVARPFVVPPTTGRPSMTEVWPR